MCVRFGIQSIHDSTVPAHFAFHAFNMQPHGSSLCMEESSADRNQRLARLKAQRHRVQQRRGSPRHSQRLASQREREARRHEQESSERRYARHNSCLHNNRLAAMRESDERTTSARPPAFYLCPSNLSQESRQILGQRFLTRS